MREVLVIGSANIDVSVTTTVLPRPGETVQGSGSLISVGGKGANQAAAAAACGAPTAFAGCVGDDAFGRMVRDELARRRVDLSALRTVAGTGTGLATIAVDAAAQNCIIVVPGANAALAPGDIESLQERVAAAAVVVLQWESPPATIRRGIALTLAAGVPVIFNPAPCHGLVLADLPRGIDYLVPNESEAAQLTGLPVTTVMDAMASAVALREAGVRCTIITLGAKGCVVADETGTRHLGAQAVTAIDTTGAGDAFVGCLAASLAAGFARDTAVRRALVYASLSTTTRGAMVSYPSAADCMAAWQRLSLT
jgi:ribokinase